MMPQNLRAVLGPTNTGKTFLAIERMLGHASGMIGFPLRLLARENYDKVVKARGAAHVALITGEERIIPAHPRYFLCTVEAMPLDREVDFLGIDEIQLCADPERGHVFTDRLLHARGREETMFMGADTAGPIIAKLVPGVQFDQRQRFSQLKYTGPKKLTQLPRRSAVIAFSANNVYGLAEVLRRRRGGTAVVLGALSPRTRNAQVAMYEAGDVDYLVATDAIGMGLNMAIDHVAFSALNKFDGHARRRLGAAEIGQIAGRAGRHMNDGTFGTTSDMGPMEPQMVEALEEHRFDKIKRLYWRSTDLDFSAAKALRRSLGAKPPSHHLTRVRTADDTRALDAMLLDDEVMVRVGGPAAVKLLWDVCQVPDFRKDLAESHARLVKRLFTFLTDDGGVIPEGWVAEAIKRLDRTDGDIDALVSRIAATRTWTYVSHRGNWLADSEGWRERARVLEDKLSDALHERLTQRFVDRRAAALVRKLSDGEPLLGAVTAADEVVVEGEVVGRMAGFDFIADADHTNDRAVMAAANGIVRDSLALRVQRFSDDENREIKLASDGVLTWQSAIVARLGKGATPHKPDVVLERLDLLDQGTREQVRVRLSQWLDGRLRRTLAPLRALEEADLGGAARGLAYQLIEGLGSVRAAQARAQIMALTRDDRRDLGALGVRLGVEGIYMPALLKRPAITTRATLAAAFHGCDVPEGIGEGAAAAAPGVGAAAWLAMGYHEVAGSGAAVRGDVLERLLARVRQRVRRQAGKSDAMMSPHDAETSGLTLVGLADVLGGFGYETEVLENGVAVAGLAAGGTRANSGANGKAGRARRGRAPRADKGRHASGNGTMDPNSPFAALATWQQRPVAATDEQNGAAKPAVIAKARPRGRSKARGAGRANGVAELAGGPRETDRQVPAHVRAGDGPAPYRPRGGVPEVAQAPEPVAARVLIEGSQRMDKWLWYARFCRTRSLATQMCKAGKVRVNRAAVSKPGALIKSGDVLTFPFARGIKVVRVMAPGQRRGPAKEAHLLYEDLTPAKAPKTGAGDVKSDPVAVRAPGSGRPTKRQRRDMDRLREGGARGAGAGRAQRKSAPAGPAGPAEAPVDGKNPS